MATKKSSAGGFKQMPKMDTTEPSVILKMAKGGHVNTKQLAKAENGFAPMSSNPKYRESMEAESGNAPKKPSMSARRQAMNPNFNKGGKVVKKSFGGMIGKLVAEAASKAKSSAPQTPPKMLPSMAGGLGGMGKMIPKVIETIKAAPKSSTPSVGMRGPMEAIPKIVEAVKGKATPQMIATAKSGMLGAVSKAMPNMRGIFRKDGGSADMSQDKAMIKKAMKQHDAQEHAGGKGTKLSLKTGGVTKGNGGGYKTGGVALGQGGYAKGGIINTEGQGGEYRNTKMDTAKVDRSPAKTGDVKLGNGGGYKMGGKASKKAYATGGNVNDEGKAVKMPSRPVSRPVANSLQSGTFARGGKVEKEEKPNLRLLKTHAGPKGHVAKVYKDKDWGEHRVKFYDPDGKYRSESDYHTDDLSDAHDTAKGQLNRYKDGGKARKFEDGGSASDEKNTVKNPKAVSDKASRELEEALNPFSMVKELAGKAKDYFVPPAGSVTKTEKSVTVSPGKKRGGRAC